MAAVTIKTQLKKAGRVAADILDKAAEIIKPGVSTEEVSQLLEEYSNYLYPAFRLASKGYHGFPAPLCISVNEYIIHGVPSGQIIKQGDLVKVDVVVEYKGWFADTARTYGVGTLSGTAIRLTEATERALQAAIDAARPGNTIGDIGYAVQQCAEQEGFSVMRVYSGHGIGRVMHDEPSIPNFGRPKEGLLLKPGMILAIEPMLFAGASDVETGPDNISIKSVDDSLTAHFEHTVVVTGSGPVIITASDRRGGETVKEERRQ